MICWIESVDPVADLCLTNQIYSVLLNAFQFKEITEVKNAHLKCFSKMAKRELVDARPSTGAPNENIVQKHLNIALLNVFYSHIFIP